MSERFYGPPDIELQIGFDEWLKVRDQRVAEARDQGMQTLRATEFPEYRVVRLDFWRSKYADGPPAEPWLTYAEVGR